MQRTALPVNMTNQALWGRGEFWHDGLFQVMPDATLVADDSGYYVAANPAACTLLGYKEERILTLSLWELMPDGDQEIGWQFWQRFLAAGRARGEYSLQRGDGTMIEVEFQAVAHVQPGYHLSVL